METYLKIEMPPLLASCYDNMIAHLKKIEVEQVDFIEGINQSINIIEEAIQQLRVFLVEHPFENNLQQIEFYKNVKPSFFSQHIYYKKLLKILINMPVGEKNHREQYLRKELQKLHDFFEENKFFYQYYRSKATYLDEILFLTKPKENLIGNGNYDLPPDPGFTITYDFIISRILANDLLYSYITKTIQDVNAESLHINFSSQIKNNLTWTDSKTGLIEIAYALQSAGVFNNGKADLKQIIDFFESSFSVDLGNTSRTFQEILSRKTGYTNFIDRLKSKLLERIDRIEEKYSR